MDREALEARFHERALQVCEDARTQIGYAANYYRRKVERVGGLAAARDWLSQDATSGFKRLLEHDRLDLSLEAVVLEPEWELLFTPVELENARKRLEAYGYFVEKPDPPELSDQLIGDEVPDEDEYPEGATKILRVNAYERDPKARERCIADFGATCVVCGFDFEEFYGSELGVGFIHVHHLNPLALKIENRITNAKEDLRPVCPNCHAMLHRRNPAIPVPELRQLVKERRGAG